MLRDWLPLVLAALLAAAPATALVIVTGDGTGNTSPPTRDPGWERFGTRSPCPPQCGLTYVYLGRSWVLTARHVTAQDVLFFGSEKIHGRVPGSEVFVGGRAAKVDLLLFRIQDAPKLPMLPIARERPAPGTPVLMVSGGQTRGDPIGNPVFGWKSKLPSVLRWGTNRVAEAEISLQPKFAATRAFATRFDVPGSPEATRHEAHAVRGDSGGAVFVDVNGGWELAGILIAATPPILGHGTSVAADLSHYRDEILEATRRR